VEGAVRSHALQRSFTTGIAFWSPKFGPPVDANPVEFGFHLKSEPDAAEGRRRRGDPELRGAQPIL